MGRTPFLGRVTYFCNSRIEWRYESKRHLALQALVCLLFNPIKVELVANMKVLDAYSKIRIHLVNSLSQRFSFDSCCFFVLFCSLKAAALRLNFHTPHPSLPAPHPHRS